MIRFERYQAKSLYGGSYDMDNSYKILLDEREIGEFHFSHADNCEVSLKEHEMYLEYIELYVRANSREVLSAIFREFSVDIIIAECNEDTASFWSCVGAHVSNKYADAFREMYSVRLSVSDLQKTIIS